MNLDLFIMLRLIGKTTPFLTESILKKTLSLSACSPKRFVIKDHFDFDKKVILESCNHLITEILAIVALLQVINSDNAVVVNFHAEWCEPCKILTPKMTELLEDNPDIDLAVVDVDNNIE